MALSAWSATAGSNSTVAGVSIAENMHPEDVNNAMRGMMAELQPSVFVDGRPTAIAGSKARVDWVVDDSRAPAENVGGLWSAAVRIARAIGQVFVSADGAANAPVATLLSYVKNAGSPAEAVSHLQVAEAGANGASVFGGNIIAFSSGGATGCKLVGLEIDVQPQAGVTPATGSGLYINAFSLECPGDAIYIEGVFGGNFASGIRVGKLNASNGAGIYGGAGSAMGALVDSSAGTYGQDAICLSNLHKIRWRGTGSVHAKAYVDASNIFHMVLPSSGYAFRDAADATSLVSIADNSSNGRVNIGGSSGELQVNGTKVVGARATGWTASTGTPSRGAFAAAAAGTASAGYVQAEAQGALTRIAALEARLIALEADARTHGLIA